MTRWPTRRRRRCHYAAYSTSVTTARSCFIDDGSGTWAVVDRSGRCAGMGSAASGAQSLVDFDRFGGLERPAPRRTDGDEAQPIRCCVLVRAAWRPIRRHRWRRPLGTYGWPTPARRHRRQPFEAAAGAQAAGVAVPGHLLGCSHGCRRRPAVCRVSPHVVGWNGRGIPPSSNWPSWTLRSGECWAGGAGTSGSAYGSA